MDFSINLRRWTAKYGNISRRLLTRQSVRDALDEWQRTEGLSASTLNHIRQALLSLWNYCDGDDAQCPASKVPKYDEGKPKPRAYDPNVLGSMLATMEPGKTKARLSLILYTGARPCEIERLMPERMMLDGDAPYIHYTTGKDGEDRVVPLNEQGLAAAKMFAEQNAWGEFSDSSMNKAFKAAYVRYRLPNGGTKEERAAVLNSLVEETRASGRRKWRLTPYVLRHTCFTELRKNGADLTDVAAIAGHKSPQTTKRYAPTVNEKLFAAMRRIERPLTTPADTSAQATGNDQVSAA